MKQHVGAATTMQNGTCCVVATNKKNAINSYLQASASALDRPFVVCFFVWPAGSGGRLDLARYGSNKEEDKDGLESTTRGVRMRSSSLTFYSS